MKRLIWLFPVVLVMCMTARAQEVVPRVEITGGYSYLDANVNGSSFGLNGGFGSATENVNSWVGGRLDVHAFSGTTSGKSVTAQTFTYGPVFSYRRFARLTPSAHVQLGAIHASTGFLGISQSAFKFALAAGGGVDYSVNPHVAIRVQADYLMSRFLNLRQDNLQFSSGFVFRFGRK
jgi:opacity protein-like surface antigen